MRVARLVTLGELREREAGRIVRALEYHDQRAAFPRPEFLLRWLLVLNFRVPRQHEILLARFPASAIDELTCRHRLFRYCALVAPAIFAAGMIPLFGAVALVVSLAKEGSSPEAGKGLLVLGCTAAAPLFGALFNLAAHETLRRYGPPVGGTDRRARVSETRADALGSGRGGFLRRLDDCGDGGL